MVEEVWSDRMTKTVIPHNEAMKNTDLKMSDCNEFLPGTCLPVLKSLFYTSHSLHNTLTTTPVHCFVQRNIPCLPTHKILIECVPLILLNYPNDIPVIILTSCQLYMIRRESVKCIRKLICPLQLFNQTEMSATLDDLSLPLSAS